MNGRKQIPLKALLLTGTVLVALDAAGLSAQSGKSAPPAPLAAEQKPIELNTSRRFPTLTEIAALTPPAIRAMTSEEKAEYELWMEELRAAYQASQPEMALAVLQKILAREEATFGPHNLKTYGTLQQLEALLRAQSRHSEAEPVARRSWQVATRIFGERHPDTLASLNKYAFALYVLGRMAEAEPLYAKALRLGREVLGERHPATIATLNNYVMALVKLGRAGEAEPLCAEALRLSRDVLGDRHVETLNSLNNYSIVLEELGQISEAEALYAEVPQLYRRLLGDSHPNTIASLNNHAIMLEKLGQASEAELLYAEALRLRREVLGERHPDTLRSLTNYAGVLTSLDRADEAELLSADALRLSRKVLGERHPDTLRSLSNYASVLEALGRAGEAEPLYADALRLSREVLGERHRFTLTSLSNYASVLKTLGRAGEAERLAAEALRLKREVLGKRHPDTLNGLNNYAHLLNALGRGIEAERHYTEALRLKREVLGPEHPETIIGAQNIAYTLLGLPTLATEALFPAGSALSSLRSRYAESGEAGVRGEAQQERDREGLQWTERLFADAAWVRAASFPAEAPGLRVESFGALQGAGSGPAARAIAETAARRYAVEAGAGDLVSERARQVELWAAAERRNIAAQAQSGGQDRAAREAMERDMAAAEARIQAIDAELKVKAPQYFAIVNQPALPVAEAQGLLGEDEAVLIVVPSEFGTHVMALTKTELVWHRADIKAGEVAEKVTALRRDLNPGEGARGPDAELAYRPSFDRATAHDLYARLITPVAATLEGKSHLFIAADGALASLPFGVLVTEAPAAGSDDSDPEVLRATPWFADAHALVQIPSLQSLAYLRCFNTGDNRRPDGCPTSDTPARAGATPSTRTTRTAASGFTGFGDPVLSGAAVKRGGRSVGALPPVDASGLTGRGVTEAGAPLMNPDELRALARLPGTRTELEAVGKLLGAPAGAIRLDTAMTEKALRSADLRNVRILHLATHGLTASEAGQRGARTEPGLVFTPPAQASSQDDGYLAASEVLTLNLTAVDWVILSACNTAAPSGTPGEPGLSGLARAFFYAGAPSLLVSHWPVFDDVAATLTVNTLRRTQAGKSRAAALQNAMRDIRNDPTNPNFAHPSAWAPFTIAGEGR